MCEPKPPQRDPEDTRKHLDFIQAIVTRSYVFEGQGDNSE